MKSTRRQPQRVPPPLIHSDFSFDGLSILTEFPGDTGLVLWKTFRSVQLWSELDKTERDHLESEEVYRARTGTLDLPSTPEALMEPLSVLAEIHQRSVASTSVVARCRAIERWAEDNRAPRTAYEFCQLAAIISTNDAAVAVDTARRARDMAEYARAESWYWQGIVRSRRSRDWEAYVRSMLGLGVTHRLRGNYSAARKTFERAGRRAGRQGYLPYLAMSFHELAVVSMKVDDLRATVRYGRKAAETYQADNPRLSALSHDVALCWMNYGFFKEALQVASAIPEDFGTPRDQFILKSTIARAAGALGRSEDFWRAAREVEYRAEDPDNSSCAPSAMLDAARGALMLGAYNWGKEIAGSAWSKAVARGESKTVAEAIAILEELEAATEALPRPKLVKAPPPVRRFSDTLGRSLQPFTDE